jgi:hypothetical protein
LIGGTARLVSTVPTDGRVAWEPSLALSVDQKIGFTHTVAIPAQGGFAADTISVGEAKTIGTATAGVYALDISGVRVGVHGFYELGSNIQSFGGRVSVDFPLWGWLSAAPAQPRS